MLSTDIDSIIENGDKMIEEDYIRKFEQAKRYKPSYEDIKSLKRYLNKFTSLLRYFVDTHHVDDPVALKNITLGLIDMIFEACSHNELVDSRLYELYAIEAILKNKKIIAQELPKIQEDDTIQKIYTADNSRSQRLVVANAYHELLKTEEVARSFNITSDMNFDALLKFYPAKGEERTSILLLKKLFAEKDTNKKIALIIENQKNRCEQYITKNLIESLTSMYDFFHAFEFNEAYIHSYNSSRKKYGFEELEYTIEDLKNSFTPEYLETLSIRELCFLNAFWSNRFAKESSVIKNGFCAIESLDLYQDVIDGKTEFDIPEETLVAALQKTHFITKLLKKTFVKHQKNVHYHELNNPSISISKERDYTPYYTYVAENIQDEYDAFFNEKGITNNNFLRDTAYASTFVNLEMLAYRKKDTSIEPLIKNMLDINHFKNWGLVRNELINGQYVDVIKTNNPLVLVVFDVQGFNMPIGFHMSRKTLTNLSRLSNASCLIPEYQFHEDFIFMNPRTKKLDNIPTNIILPIPKEHKKIIIDKARSDIENKGLWEHFYHLVNGKIPEHFTVPIKKGKQTIYVREPRCYTDLSTGKQYIEDGKNLREVTGDDGR